ncbi:MAG: glycosyltransferase [Thermodesulfovibrionia bacterium]
MISVIIPTLNAQDSLHRILTSLKEQTILSETIVIDSLSSDNTVEIAESYGVKIIIIKREDFDHGGTRNLAVTHSSGDIIVFLTQDALPEDKYFIENLIKPLEKAGIAAAYGRQIPQIDARPTEKFARFFNYPETPLVKDNESLCEIGIKTFFFSNVSSAIRKKEFEELGGFAENLIMNEDMLFAARLIFKGYKIVYVPEARVIHSHNYSLVQQFKRYFDIGVFLKKNSRELEYAKVGNAGAEFLKGEFRYLFKNKAYIWLPYSIGEGISKYVGYHLGMKHTLLPNALRKRISMHSSYW